MEGLFGEDFAITIAQPDVKALIKKTQELVDSETDAEKLLKSKKISIKDRLNIIRTNVLKILGKQKENTCTIKTKEAYFSYIDHCIANGYVAVDTETNNSLDPVTCQLMGLCLYTPGEKQAYIPVNHVDLETGERLTWQLTEEDCREGLSRLLASNCFIIMHNGKFDYEVLKSTCQIEVPPNWDTQVAARLLDENELAGLKSQYTTKIDPTQEKYSIDKLFENIQYAFVDPELFALYAATDALLTFKLYEYQLPIMTAEDMKKVYWLFLNIEMPIVVVTAKMELKGVSINTKFGKKLKLKYRQLLTEIDAEIDEELKLLEPTILAWKLDEKRGGKTAHIYMPTKSKKSMLQLEKTYTLIEPDMIEVEENGKPKLIKNPQAGKRYKLGKRLWEVLSDPINLASSDQLAVLFYDILECPVVSKKSPRGTGQEELKAISERCPDLKLCKLILKRRGIVKLITTYIDVIPALVKHWPDGRIRFHLNALGTDTGRYSSGGKLKFFENGEPVVVSGINCQNIPSHNKQIRMLFQGDTKYHTYESVENTFIINEIQEVETPSGWVFAKDLKIGDTLCLAEGEQVELKAIEVMGKKVKLFC